MKRFRNLKIFVLVAFLAFALVFIGVDFIESQVKTQGKPSPKPPKPGKSKTEWIEFTGDLVGGQPVDGCCPNAGPFPPYSMCLYFKMDGTTDPTGTWYDGELFISGYGAGRKENRLCIVQFSAEGTDVAIEIIGGVTEIDKWNRIVTVTFTDEPCYDFDGQYIKHVNFTLVRRPY